MPPALSVDWGYGAELARNQPASTQTRFRYLPTVRDETPVPLDLGPSGVFDAPTGQMTVAEPPDVIVRKATEHIMSMAFLAIDPDADAWVDQLVARRLEHATTRPLQKKV